MTPSHRLLLALVLVSGPAFGQNDLEDLDQRLARSIGYDAVENISSAFGNWIDDQQWPLMSQQFARDGWRQKYLVGFYVGPDHIRKSETIQVAGMASPRRAIRIHLRVQPVIDIAAGSRSAYLRTRLLHFTSGWTEPGAVKNGMYPNDAATLEDGIWKLSIVGIDEPYFVSDGWAGGWARVPPISDTRRHTMPPMMQHLIDEYPPDIPLKAMPVRQGAFTIGDRFVHFPEVKPMWFHYRNPVTGRLPDYYCPDMRTCEPGFKP